MEEHFKNKLKNHKVDWDKEELLGDLKQELSLKKPASNWKWFLLLPLLCMVTCWGLNRNDLFNGNENGARQITAEDSEVLVPDGKNVVMRRNEDIQTGASDLNANNDNTIPLASNQNGRIAASTITNSTLSDKKTLNTSSVLSQNKNSKSWASAKDDFGEKKFTYSSSENQPTKESLVYQKKTDTNETIEVAKATVLKSLDQNESNFSPTKNTARKSVVEDKEKQKVLSLLDLLPVRTIAFVPFDWKYEFRYPLRLEGLLAIDKNEYSESNKEKSISGIENSFYISGIGEIGLINRVTNFQSSDLNFLERLEENENTISSRVLLSANFGVGFQHHSGWSLQSGFEYQQITEFFNYDHVKSQATMGFDEKALYFLDQSADTLFFGDSTLIAEIETRKVRHWNKHTYYSIPLEVGYHYSLGKANVFGTAGIIFAIKHNFRGRVNQLNVDGSNQIIDNPKFAFKNRIGYRLGIGVEYPLFNQARVFTNISYRRSSTITYAVYEQFNHSFSLGLGIKYLMRGQ